VDWIAAVIVAACLVALTVDFSRRWRRPSVYIDPRSPVAWVVTAIVVAVVVAVNVID
jgi:hypothetical protein